MSPKLTSKQRVQEDEYGTPYHYRGLFSEEHALLRDVEYISYLQLVKKEIEHLGEHVSVLDVGCGDARFFFEMKNNSRLRVGIDYSEAAIRFARAFNPDAEFFATSIEKFTYPKKFDVITLVEVLEHFPPAEIPRILAALKKHLAPNGKLFVTVPSTHRKIIEKHYQHFTPFSLREALSPHFMVERMMGYEKVGRERTIFHVMRKIALLLFPFRKRIGMIENFVKSVRAYYVKNVLVASPEESDGLFAIARVAKK